MDSCNTRGRDLDVSMRRCESVRVSLYSWCINPQVMVYMCVGARFLQVSHGALCCNILQCAALCCSSLKHIATHWNTLQYIAIHCNILQTDGYRSTCSATPCNILQYTATRRRKHDEYLSTYSATYCNTLQHISMLCNTIEKTATHCNTLQHTATHCNTLQHNAPEHFQRGPLMGLTPHPSHVTSSCTCTHRREGAPKNARAWLGETECTRVSCANKRVLCVCSHGGIRVIQWVCVDEKVCGGRGGTIMGWLKAGGA